MRRSKSSKTQPHLGRPTKELLDQFVSQVTILESVDFPQIAFTMGLNWFKDLKPLLKTDTEFLQGMQEALETIKYKLYSKLLQVGIEGKGRRGATPEISYIKAIVQCIDSGMLLGQAGSEDTDQGFTGDHNEHLKRLGIHEEKREPKTGEIRLFGRDVHT